MSPDICMCQDDNCHIRLRCYRFLAKPNEHSQSYFTGSPRKVGECDKFWDIKERGMLQKMEGKKDNNRNNRKSRKSGTRDKIR